jgi:hypothetical protein
MTYRIQAFLEFESEAQALDAQAQLQARMTNTTAFGGPLGRVGGYGLLHVRSEVGGLIWQLF